MSNIKKVSEELKSELFALINTIIRLDNKYLEGVLDETFFKKSLKSAINNLLKIQFKIQEENLSLKDLLEEMEFMQDYNKAISIINNASSLDFDTSEYPKSISSSILQIPSASSEITSSFITLMDGLKLVEQENYELIFNLFQDLLKNLDKFPGLEIIRDKITAIFQNFTAHKNKFIQSIKFRNSIIDELYTAYNHFQQKLELKL
ncbi:MAG: hypothetical protein ACFE9R_00505 [Candidatus Hermodarchaeota archaeon]